MSEFKYTSLQVFNVFQATGIGDLCIGRMQLLDPQADRGERWCIDPWCGVKDTGRYPSREAAAEQLLKIHTARVQDPLLGDTINHPMLRWFQFSHLPEYLQSVSKEFHELVTRLILNVPDGPERQVALRKLLEAKDAAVRATLHPGC